MEFYLKEHVFNSVVLIKYSDFSRKVIFQSKLNQNAVLAKANPTSKACEKFLVNSQLELKLEIIPELINVLRILHTTGTGQTNFAVVATYENWRREIVRVIIHDSSYGGYEILQQKKKIELEDEDMEFS